MSAFLDDYVERFNECVRGGDFAGLLELYAEDGELVFVGVPAGPFQGREAIAAAYRAQPPDDEITVSEAHEEPGTVRCRFAWQRGGGGWMRFERANEGVRRLTVTFD